MRKHYFTSFLFSLLCLNSFGQIEKTNEFDEKIAAYFKLDYETIFTHINKMKYFEGEELWFKTYIYDVKRQFPFVSSTNIYISIYDDNGNLKKKKIYAAEKGMTHGNFKIDSTYTPGTYFLKTTTNWMQNFEYDHSYLTEFQIMGSDDESNTRGHLTYDLQLLPEGGHIIEDAINYIGFKITDSFGNSTTIISGKILDSNNTVITLFKSNQFGHGKFVFKPETGKNYTVEVALETGETLTIPIKNIQKIGVSLTVDNSKRDNVYIKINTNKATISNLINDDFQLVSHRDGLVNKIDVNFTENKFSYLFKVEKTFLNKGINIITLFDKYSKPIAERIIYNHSNTSVKSIVISELVKEKDSTVVRLKTNEDIKNVNLSISVLPSSTKANQSSSNILSAFILRPYINGNIENPWYYFNDIDRKKIYDLDLLLLTQGWSSYSWNSLFNNPPNLSYNFETGFTIKGKLNNYDYKDDDMLILQSKYNGIKEEFSLDEKGFFSFENLYLKEGTTVNFTLKNKNDKLSKPSIYFNIYPSLKDDKIIVQKKGSKIKIDNIQTVKDKSFIFDDQVTVLDSIEIRTASGIKKPKPKNKPYGMSNARHVSYADSKNFNSLITQQIRNFGFDVINNGLNVKIVSRRAFTLKGALSPLVFLDNVNISDDLMLISNLYVADVEEMFVSTTSNINASPAGVIHIFSKTGGMNFTKTKYNNSNIDFGFSVSKKYYTPLYNKFENEDFKNYGVLNWIPNLSSEKTNELKFKIPNYYYDSVNLYIEGMSEDGSLFSKVETITIE